MADEQAPTQEAEQQEAPATPEEQPPRIGHPHTGHIREQSQNMVSGISAAIANIMQQLGKSEHAQAVMQRDIGTLRDAWKREREAKKLAQQLSTEALKERDAANQAHDETRQALVVERSKTSTLEEDLSESRAQTIAIQEQLDKLAKAHEALKRRATKKPAAK